jgi:hypothetical protein
MPDTTPPTSENARMNLADYLDEAGYEIADSLARPLGRRADVYTLTAPGIGAVRVVIGLDDPYSTDVFGLDRYQVERWSAAFYAAPDAAILGAMAAAEAELRKEVG